MSNSLFSRITSDYYTRCYEINPERFSGIPVKIHAECRKNTEYIDYEYYWLDLYYSIGQGSVRDFIIGVSFGEEEMDQELVDMEIDRQVEHIIGQPNFPTLIRDYLKHFG